LPHGENGKEDCAWRNFSKSVIAFFGFVVGQILTGNNPRILENQFGCLKADAVIAKVLPVFGGVPVELAHLADPFPLC
jgi:hypothetical protein